MMKNIEYYEDELFGAQFGLKYNTGAQLDAIGGMLSCIYHSLSAPKGVIAKRPDYEADSIFCPVCGKEINELDNYCYNCGQQLLWEN